MAEQIPTPPHLTPTYYVGLDLGQASDPTAMCVLERQPKTNAAQPKEATLYHIVGLKRWHLGTSYTEIVADVAALFERPALQWSVLIVDGTGVGRAVVDMISQAKPKALLRPAIITSGNGVSLGDDGYWHVAKVELVSVLQMLLQSRRLKIAEALPEAKTLWKELSNFRVRVTAAANETFEADWREGEHDDLVFAATLACWWAEVMGDPGVMTIVERPPNGFRCFRAMCSSDRTQGSRHRPRFR